MSDYNFGPEWFWRLLTICAGIGVLAIIYAIIKGIIWAFQHVKIG